MLLFVVIVTSLILTICSQLCSFSKRPVDALKVKDDYVTDHNTEQEAGLSAFLPVKRFIPAVFEQHF